MSEERRLVTNKMFFIIPVVSTRLDITALVFFMEGSIRIYAVA